MDSLDDTSNECGILVINLRHIQSVFRIRDPVHLAPGSGIRFWDGKNPDPGSESKHPRSYFRELSNHFLGQKYLNSLLIQCCGPGSEIRKSNNPYPLYIQYGTYMEASFLIPIPLPPEGLHLRLFVHVSERK